MRASGVEVQHTELDDLLLDIHERQQQPEVEAAEASKANKKLGKERQEAEETRRLSMECLSKTQKRRSNSDDVTSLKQKKSRSSGTDTIAHLREKTEKDFE